MSERQVRTVVREYALPKRGVPLMSHLTTDGRSTFCGLKLTALNVLEGVEATDACKRCEDQRRWLS